MNKSGKIDHRDLSTKARRETAFSAVYQNCDHLFPSHLWCIHLRKCIMKRGCEMDEMLDFLLIILTSSRIGYMCKTTWQKKTTPPPTTQWTFRIQSDATIKQIPRRPAAKSPINTINLWRCGCETGCAFHFDNETHSFLWVRTFDMQSIHIYIYIYLKIDTIYPKLQDRFPIQLIHINCQETEARQEEGGLSTTGATTNSNTFSYGSRGGPRSCSPSKWPFHGLYNGGDLDHWI